MSSIVLDPEQDPLQQTDEVDSHSISPLQTTKSWWVCGNELPRDEIVFFAQVIISYIVIVTCIVNLSLQNGDSNLWTALLSCTLGYLLPSPSLQTDKTPAHTQTALVE